MDDNDLLRSRQKIISKLTEARLEKQMSQAELANLIGTQRSNICRIESGTQNLSLDMLIKISKALGKDVNMLLEERKDSMNTNYSLRLYIHRWLMIIGQSVSQKIQKVPLGGQCRHLH